MCENIDFVIPWVDGGDEKWNRKKSAYLKTHTSLPTASTGTASDIDDSSARYRDWGLLKYWFRGVAKFAPWVHRIFLITDHQIPDWINTDNPQLQIVDHADYIPKQYLPTFSSHTIELNMHRIDNLSEHFVYFNDDIFLVGMTHPSDFFKHGLPRTTAIATPLRVHYGDYFFSPVITAAVITHNFDFHHSVRSNWCKWFTPLNGRDVIRTLTCLPYPYFTGFMEDHLANAFLKSTFNEVWEAEPQILDTTCRHHIRHELDVNQYLMREWQVASGKFVPFNRRIGKTFQLGADWKEELNAFSDVLSTNRVKMVCINDTSGLTDVDAAITSTRSIFQHLLPEKSSFEQ